MRRTRVLALMVAATIAAACGGGSNGDAVVGLKRTGAGGDSGQTGGHDTTVHVDSSVHVDTTVHVDTVVGSATPGFHGRVWGQVPVAGDTAMLNGIGNVRVELYAGATASGAPEQPVAITTTGAAGLFLIDPVADGVYHARAVPPAASHYTPATLSWITIAGDRMTTIREANIVLGGTP